MSRFSEVLNRLELAAKRLGMSIEEAVEVLEGKHRTHSVVSTAAVASPSASTTAHVTPAQTGANVTANE